MRFCIQDNFLLNSQDIVPVSSSPLPATHGVAPRQQPGHLLGMQTPGPLWKLVEISHLGMDGWASTEKCCSGLHAAPRRINLTLFS